jgi:two-component system chemotaxis sensor kinase CheA
MIAMDDFEKSLKLGFIDEALQVIEELETLLLELEQNPEARETIDGVFRGIHNIKGSSKAVGFEQLGVFCHELETYMMDIKTGSKKVVKPVIDKLLFSKDFISNTLALYKTDLDATVDVEGAVNVLKKQETSTAQEPTATEETADAAPADSALIPITKKVAAASQADESVRVNLRRVDKIINAVGELVVLQAVLRERVGFADDQRISRVADDLGKIIKEVQGLSMSLRMVPAKTLIQKLQRISRDTAGALDKDVDFIVNGENTEIDKTILEMISDPLVHIIRNAVDHGFETKEQRRTSGKNLECKLELTIAYVGGTLLIRVKDDGRGLDPERILSKAQEKGIVKAGQTLTEQQIQELIFAPGFSTKQDVTEVSGRGVGMDVVKTGVEALGGKIEIKSIVNQGTEFSIYLPLTLAIIDGLVVKVGVNRYVIPLAQVTETFRVQSDAVKTDKNSGGLFCLRGQDYPIFSISKVLNSQLANPKAGIGILSSAGSFSFVAVVEDIIGQQQIVVKQIGTELSGLKGYIGSAVLGDGKPALIVDLTELVERDRGNKSRETA